MVYLNFPYPTPLVPQHMPTKVYVAAYGDTSLLTEIETQLQKALRLQNEQLQGILDYIKRNMDPRYLGYFLRGRI